MPARCYGDPVLLVLDEPNSNLDNDGTVALNTAIRTTKAAGGAVLIMAHRPAAIQECELLLVLEDGMRRAFGPRDAGAARNGQEPRRNTDAGPEVCHERSQTMVRPAARTASREAA